jgi:magnesium chelatase accessory protein
MRWHVQCAGHGPALLLLHGTGSGTHSWRRLLPLLAERFSVIAPDLPGHAFSDPLPCQRGALIDFGDALGDLLRVLGASPDVVVGHSAGAAIALWMCLAQNLAPRAVVSINGALLPVRGMPGPLFTSAARMLAGLPLMPRLIARQARDPAAVARVIRGTGSVLAEEDIRHYALIAGRAQHVAGTLAMVAHWDLRPLLSRVGEIGVPVHLLYGTRDLAVPPRDAERAARLLLRARTLAVQELGHLAHEEAPERFAHLIQCIASHATC